MVCSSLRQLVNTPCNSLQRLVKAMTIEPAGDESSSHLASLSDSAQEEHRTHTHPCHLPLTINPYPTHMVVLFWVQLSCWSRDQWNMSHCWSFSALSYCLSWKSTELTQAEQPAGLLKSQSLFCREKVSRGRLFINTFHDDFWWKIKQLDYVESPPPKKFHFNTSYWHWLISFLPRDRKDLFFIYLYYLLIYFLHSLYSCIEHI